MFGIGTPYLALAAVLALLGAFVAGNLHGSHAKNQDWLVAVAAQKQEAAATLLAATQRAANLDAHNAELARNLDEAHHAAVAEIDATRDAFARRLRDAERRGHCANPGTVEAAHPGQPADAASRGDGGPGGVDFAAGERLREVGLKLQADVKECWAWAQKVGR